MPELNWLGDQKARRAARHVQYRLLQPVAEVGEPGSENLLIQGDNLDALKSLLPLYAGRVKCVFIDPPYNTKSAFEHYDDNLEHSQWLSMMYPRLVLLRELLSEDGSIWVTIDDNEVHYLKVAMDEVFGRVNFLGDIAYERSGVSGLGQGGGFLVNTHERILAYAKSKKNFVAHDLSGAGPLEQKDMKRYNQVMVDAGVREEVARFKAPSTGEDVVIYRHASCQISSISLRKFDERKDEILNEYVENFPKIFRLTSVQAENEFQNKIMSLCGDGLYSADYLVSRGRAKGENVTTYYVGQQIVVWLSDTAKVEAGEVVRTGKLSDFWPHRDIPKADLANEGGVDFRRGKKPEALLARILRISTKEKDIVLDSFLGSGTAAAVAHKMARNWIGIEAGAQAETHCFLRLSDVVAGDQTGISQTVGWQGGGGFRFMRLGEPVFDAEGRIREDVSFAPLAAYLWFLHTRTPWGDAPASGARKMPSPILGVHGETAVALLYNGVLGDRRPQAGNVLTHAVFEELRACFPEHSGPWLIYGEACRLGPATLKRFEITFKQIPYDIRRG
ncbi:site-specific DNA-methyltransferase [Lysobacter brunescens]|uniref:site-specific DNA-methyltransferase (adenine-specific) n=1 Tax=Lysobacter brunescens TaxID=262323 RepID=A0ABW2YIB0_9GAMM